jgi:hypothetical protein
MAGAFSAGLAATIRPSTIPVRPVISAAAIAVAAMVVAVAVTAINDIARLELSLSCKLFRAVLVLICISLELLKRLSFSFASSRSLQYR